MQIRRNFPKDKVPVGKSEQARPKSGNRPNVPVLGVFVDLQNHVCAVFDVDQVNGLVLGAANKNETVIFFDENQALA